MATDGVVYDLVRRPGWPYEEEPQTVVARDADTGTVLWERGLAPGQHAYELVAGPDAVHVAAGGELNWLFCKMCSSSFSLSR